MEENNLNPFAVISKTETTALAQTDQQKAIAEVQAAMVIARANPRDQRRAMDNILNACTRPTLAESATYEYSRGGTAITGPSIRLAEAIAQNWGNMSFGVREISQENGSSTIQTYAWDIESNTRREMTFQVPHKRYTKKGMYKLEDPRDIYETVANLGARRLRACILSLIPGDVVEAAVNQCEITMKAKTDTSPETIKKMIEAFSIFKVTKSQIEKRIQRRIDSITSAQVIALKKIYTSLKDGMSVPGDWFDVDHNEPSVAASIIGSEEPKHDQADQQSNKEMIKKYTDLIDMMKTPEEIDRWRSSIGTALARDLPNDDDQMAVYAYAEDAYQSLK